MNPPNGVTAPLLKDTRLPIKFERGYFLLDERGATWVPDTACRLRAAYRGGGCE